MTRTFDLSAYDDREWVRLPYVFVHGLGADPAILLTMLIGLARLKSEDGAEGFVLSRRYVFRQVGWGDDKQLRTLTKLIKAGLVTIKMAGGIGARKRLVFLNIPAIQTATETWHADLKKQRENAMAAELRRRDPKAAELRRLKAADSRPHVLDTNKYAAVGGGHPPAPMDSGLGVVEEIHADYTEADMALADKLRAAVRTIKPDAAPHMAKWAAAMCTLVERHGREEVVRVLDWYTRNIKRPKMYQAYSPRTLGEKWSKILKWCNEDEPVLPDVPEQVEAVIRHAREWVPTANRPEFRRAMVLAYLEIIRIRQWVLDRVAAIDAICPHTGRSYQHALEYISTPLATLSCFGDAIRQDVDDFTRITPDNVGEAVLAHMEGQDYRDHGKLWALLCQAVRAPNAPLDIQPAAVVVHPYDGRHIDDVLGSAPANVGNKWD